jgi:hypothetical protein
MLSAATTGATFQLVELGDEPVEPLGVVEETMLMWPW